MVEAEVGEVEGAMVMMEMMVEVVGEVVGEGYMDEGDEGHHCHPSMRRDGERRMFPCQILVEVGRR